MEDVDKEKQEARGVKLPGGCVCTISGLGLQPLWLILMGLPIPATRDSQNFVDT